MAERNKWNFENILSAGPQGVRDFVQNEIFYARSEERNSNIFLAAKAMCDAGLTDETIMKMLQKYWDLRESEAAMFLSNARDILSRDPSEKIPVVKGKKE